MDNFISIALALFLVINALGSLPIYLTQIESVAKNKQRRVAIRELAIALIVMTLFFLLGQLFLKLLGVSKTTVEISGGVVLLIIALRLIFQDDESEGQWKKGKPFIVPIATPIFASPSFFAVITIFAESDVSNVWVFLALVLAWLLSSLIFLFGKQIFRLIQERGLLACQRLTGLLIALIAVQMLLQGISDLVMKGL